MNEIILLNYLKGKVSDDECCQVEAWCEASSENRKTLEQLYYTLFVDERLLAMNSVDTEESLKKLKTEIRKKGAKQNERSVSWRRYATTAAAFVAGVVLTTGITWGMLSDKVSNYAVFTEPGQRAKVMLPDGSKVWLNSSTQLAYKVSFWKSDRQVDLTGEAYFEVAHDKSSPFVVNSKNIKMCVLGTRFNVRARAAEERVVTTLLQGSVRIDSPMRDGSGFMLKPGQTLDMDADTYKAELLEYANPDDVLLWIKGKLLFEQRPLLDIANSLEKHFDIHFVFSDEYLKHECFTCEFKTDDTLGNILSVLSETKRFDYKQEGRTIRIYKRG